MDINFSLLTHLVCSECGSVFDTDHLHTYCHTCQAPLLAQYDLSSIKQKLKPPDFQNRQRGMWRWHELLPVINSSNVVTLGEGDTPVLKLDRLGTQLGLHKLFLKDESINPTGTFKARGLSAAISKAKELGVKKLVIPTAGNAGGAMAAYSSRAGLDAVVVMPQKSPLANIEESRIVGAKVILIEGLINEAAVIARRICNEENRFDLSTFKEPYRLEGKKIMGFELAEYFQYKLPNIIVYPTGGGTGLVGMWKAFEELLHLGWLVNENLPRMIAVQSDGCAPIPKAFDEGRLNCDTWENAYTIATGLCVPKSFADKLILKILHKSGGNAIKVSDIEIREAQKRLATCEGIFVSPEGAATLAGVSKLLDLHLLDPDERIVIFNTGSGIKYLK